MAYYYYYYFCITIIITVDCSFQTCKPIRIGLYQGWWVVTPGKHLKYILHIQLFAFLHALIFVFVHQAYKTYMKLNQGQESHLVVS